MTWELEKKFDELTLDKKEKLSENPSPVLETGCHGNSHGHYVLPNHHIM